MGRKPIDLKAADFGRYGSEGRGVARKYLDVLRSMPLSLLVAFLRELRSYDWKFPKEQEWVEYQLSFLQLCPEIERRKLYQPFNSISVPSGLQEMDWVNDPKGFSQNYSAVLWSMGKMDEYRKAATDLVEEITTRRPEEHLPARRVVMASIGRGAEGGGVRLFRKLRPLGVHLTNVQSGGAQTALVELLASRAQKYSSAYAHWYIDGGSPWEVSDGAAALITQVSYPSLDRVRQKVLNFMSMSTHEDSGPETLERRLEHLEPRDIEMEAIADDPKMQHYCANVFTEGSGTQIFSTTFVQWAAREALQRAQPLTLLVRYAPRQKQKPMNEMFQEPGNNETDPEGSLIDGDMGAFYTYIEMQKLSKSAEAVFLAWFEDHSEAVLVCPSMPRGTESNTRVTMPDLIQMALA